MRIEKLRATKETGPIRPAEGGIESQKWKGERENTQGGEEKKKQDRKKKTCLHLSGKKRHKFLGQIGI